jgi:hypothetical protein
MKGATPMLARMQSQVERWEASFDRRAIFLACYAVMTRNMLNSINSGIFNDPSWVGKLLERFAEYYFEALETYQIGNPGPPLVWRETFNAALNPRILPVQHLILGVNAHINYDLVLTLVEILRNEWTALNREGRSLRYLDHSTINRIIAQSIDEVQDEILVRYSPEMDLVDKAFGKLDEWAIARLISLWREQVWRRTQKWLEAESLDEQDRLHQNLERACLRKSKLILLQWRYFGKRKPLIK